MPIEGVRGSEYCHVQVMPNTPLHKQIHVNNGQFVIAATRRQKTTASMGQMPPEEDFRYWSGSVWVRSVIEARIYASQNAARNEGESIRIWNNVPDEWRNDERRR
jgi:hypothetical protein